VGDDKARIFLPIFGPSELIGDVDELAGVVGAAFARPVQKQHQRIALARLDLRWPQQTVEERLPIGVAIGLGFVGCPPFGAQCVTPQPHADNKRHKQTNCQQ